MLPYISTIRRFLMKRLVSTALAVALLLGLGALAVLARGGGEILTPADNVVSAAAQPQTAAAPDVPASSKYNMIALPLNVQANWSSSNPAIPLNSQGLAQYVGLSSVTQVLRWDPARQAYDQWFPADGSGLVGGQYTEDPYALATGRVYRLLLNNANLSLNLVSFVGDVPDAGSIKFILVGATACKYNQVSIPLEQSDISDSDKLATSMGGPTKVSQVLRWDATRQAYDQWFPADGSGLVGGLYTETAYPVQIGYPYVVCLLAGANNVQWP
jgi:hypothetical protein